MIWLALLIGVLALSGIAEAAGNRRDAVLLAYSAAALLGVQVWRHVPMPGDTIWLAFCASWLLVVRAMRAKVDAKARHVDTSCVMLIGVSLCYSWGWVVSQPFTPDAPQLIVAEALAVISWITMGGPSIAVILRRRIGSVVSTPDRRADILSSISAKDARK